MLKNERQSRILHELNLHNRVLSASLCSMLDVSEDTVRRDLYELERDGKLLKVHGGAILPYPIHGAAAEPLYALEEKKVIARKAVRLIKEGSFVLTSGGSTIIEMARQLPQDLRATIMSGSIPAVYEYMQHENLDVIVLGDKINKTARITVGADVINKLKSIQADVCILGINAIDTHMGVTDNDWEVVQTKKQMMASARKVACLTISEKLDTTQPIKVAGLESIDILVTELNPDSPRLEKYRAAGIEVF